MTNSQLNTNKGLNDDEFKIAANVVLDYIDSQFAKLCLERSKTKKNAMLLPHEELVDCYRQAIIDAKIKFTTNYKLE